MSRADCPRASRASRSAPAASRSRTSFVSPVEAAAIKGVEAVDTGVGRVVEATLAVGGGLLITADHGNAEQLIEYDTGKPFTAHTANPVPLYLVVPQLAQAKLRADGILRRKSHRLRHTLIDIGHRHRGRFAHHFQVALRYRIRDLIVYRCWISHRARLPPLPIRPLRSARTSR